MFAFTSGFAIAFEEEDSEEESQATYRRSHRDCQIAEEHGAYQARRNSGGTEERDQKVGITRYSNVI